MKIAVATAILHNLSIHWGEIMPDPHPELDDYPVMPLVPNNNQVQVLNVLNPVQQRRLGQQTRDQLHVLMEQEEARRRRNRNNWNVFFSQ